MRTSILRAAGVACAAFAVVGAITPITVAHASGNPLAGLTADQIATKAIADLKAASSVHLAGSGTSSGEAFTVSMSLTPNGCNGTISLSRKGAFVLLAIGKNAWIQPSKQLWESEGIPSSELSQVVGKYIAVTGSAAKEFSAELDDFCTPKDVADSVSPLTGFVKGGTSTIGGQAAVEIKETSDSGFMDVSVSAKPEVLRIDDPGSGNLSFSHYGARVTLTPPPPSDIIKLPGL